MQNSEQQHGNQQAGGNGGREHGQPRVHVRVQTPRGLWSMTEPAIASIRPDNPISTHVSTVIADARTVFHFVEQDSLYTLFLNGAQMDPGRPLASYHVTDDALLVLSVQGGNASGQ
jgi:hypothetical protein